ncbi:MAG: helix-turn-helix transcriptional regulator [Lachnospiraceae bacterium]|nr:helix-turn-helix transcriptional regulator [Lachnospiraceae bacterium]
MNVQIFKTNLETLTGETKQNRIADVLNISASKVSKWFAGALLPTISDLLNISKTYHCSIDWLIGNEHENEVNFSEYGICKLLINLDREFLIDIRLEEIEQKITFEVGNRESLETNNQKYKQIIPVIYFQNSLALEDILLGEEIYNPYDMVINSNGEVCLENKDSYEDEENENRVTTTADHTSMSINDFLSKYIQLKEALYKKIIPINIFDDILDSYLKCMSKTDYESKEVGYEILNANSSKEKLQIAIERYAVDHNIKFEKN